MSSDMSVYAKTEVIKYFFTATAMGTRPTAWTVRLHTADPGTTGASEVTETAYAEQSATWTQTAGSVANTAAIVFPTVTGTPYTVTHVSIWDTAGTPNCQYFGALPLAKLIGVGEALSFAIGELVCDIVATV